MECRGEERREEQSRVLAIVELLYQNKLASGRTKEDFELSFLHYTLRNCWIEKVLFLKVSTDICLD